MPELKVLFFRPTLSQGGADRVTATLLGHLDRKRFQVHIALLRAAGEFVPDVPADVRMHVLGSGSLWRCAPALARLLRQEQPDVLFSTSSAANIPAVVAHEMSRHRGRCILSERNALLRGDPTVKRRVELALKKVLYRRADCVTAVSSGVAEELRSSVGVAPERLAVVYNPVVSDDLAALAAQPVEHPWFRDDVPIVLGVGRLVPQKDFSTMIDAFARVRRRLPVRLFVLGEGPLMASLRAQADREGIGQDVFFAGFDKNPFKYMARSTLYLQTSRAEGLPGSLIQAMACGAPSVATDCEHGPSEVITRPGEDGWLVPVGDAARAAEAVEALLSQPQQRAKIAKKGQESAGRFSLASSLALYTAAIAGTPLSTT